MLFRDGDAIVVRWLPDESDVTHPFLRFVGRGEARLAADEVVHGLTDFVLRVLERVEELDAPEVEALSRDWTAITTIMPDERELCVCSARLGLDPYDPDELTEPREELLKTSMSSLEGELKGDRGAPVVVACQHGDVKPERFRLARSLFFRHFATARERRLVTPAHTWDQRASRAFAAEFLAPAGALAKQVAGPVSFSDVDELGDEYRVSSLVIEHQIDNHQLGYVTDA